MSDRSETSTNAIDDETIIDVREDHSERVIEVRGDIDIASAPGLHQQLMAALGDQGFDVVVDLSKLDFIDSSGMGVLVNARRRAEAMQANLRMVLPEGPARFPFEVTGLAAMFEADEARAKNPDAGVGSEHAG